MRVLSTNVGKIEQLATSRGGVESAIRKKPMRSRVKVTASGLEGDSQADRRFHGGVNKAVYLYPREHYPRWQEFLQRGELPYGYLGENLTVEGLDEETICIGDRLAIGTTVLVARSPRLPCFKLAALMGTPRAARFMLDTGLTGVYLSVDTPGELGTGDAIEIMHRDPRRMPVRRYVEAMMRRGDAGLMQSLLAHDELPADRRSLLKERVAAGYEGNVE